VDLVSNKPHLKRFHQTYPCRARHATSAEATGCVNLDDGDDTCESGPGGVAAGVLAVLSVEGLAGEAHLSLEAMARLRSGRMETGEIHAHLLSHLVSRCEECRTVDQRLAELRQEVGHWDDVVNLLEGAQAPELWRRLEPLSHQRRLEAVASDEELHTWVLCRLLVKMSREVARQRPAAAAELAYLAIRTRGHLGAAYHEDWLQDLAALSFAALGDARRRLGEPHGAADAFAHARELLAAGTGSPGVEAQVLALEALLLRDQHRLGEAIELLVAAHTIAASTRAELADPHLAGRALAHRAWCLYHLGHPEPALAQLLEAQQLVSEAREPWLSLAIRQGQVWCAIALGRTREADALLVGVVELAARHGDDSDRVRLRRPEARIAAAFADRGSAERVLREAVAQLVELHEGVEAALAILDLALVYLEGGAEDSLHKLAAEVLPVFSGPDLDRNHFAALLLFEQACASGRLTAELVRQLAGMIERHRRPSLGWWSGLGTVLTKDKGDDAAAL
jgi:tetratricopeptide (TPR) repeat protein